MRRSRLPEAVHGPQQFEEAREEPLEGGAGPGRGYGGRDFESFEREKDKVEIIFSKSS